MAYINGKETAVIVNVSYDEDYLASICNKTIDVIKNSKATTIWGQFQQSNTNLVEVDLPSLTAVYSQAFSGCTNLVKINFPAVKIIEPAAFALCAFTEAYFPECTTLEGSSSWGHSFQICYFLKRARFTKLTTINAGAAFNTCANLKTFIIETNSVCSLTVADAFSDTAISNGSGYIYVPKALVNSYKSATNWSVYAAQIRAIEDYPEVLEGWE